MTLPNKEGTVRWEQRQQMTKTIQKWCKTKSALEKERQQSWQKGFNDDELVEDEIAGSN